MDQYYILEVQKELENGTLELWEKFNGKFKHVGYMNRIFTSKREAEMHYNANNKHMRALNTGGDWRSDWDPITKLRFIVRRGHGEMLMIKDFWPDE